jgi:putative transposase
MNTDPGSQFTSFAWTDRLQRSNVRISMDGKGRFLDEYLPRTALAVPEI